MADMKMLVDIATVIPVNLLPLLDDTDFKTLETGVVYNAAGMDLRWNFVTPGGSMATTAVVPTTGGVYDWVHLGDAIYSIEMPASGGASVNNDTEGFGWFTGVITGVLPFRGPIIQFSPANVVNSLVAGSDLLDVNLAQINGSADADRMLLAVQGTVKVTVGVGSTVSSIVTSALDPAASVTDQYKGRIFTYKKDTTTASLRGQATDITASTAGGVRTVTPLTTAPVSGDLGSIT